MTKRRIEEDSLEGSTTSDSSQYSAEESRKTPLTEIEYIVNLVANHTGNPRKLTENLLSNQYSLENIEEVFLVLSKDVNIAPHIIKAIENALLELQKEAREKIIKKHAELIEREVNAFTGTHEDDLVEVLITSQDQKGKFYKPEAFKLLLDENNFSNQFAAHAVKQAYLYSKIGHLKNRDLKYVGDKIGGITSGAQVKKLRIEDDVNIKKHSNVWLQKTGASIAGIGEDVCEYIGTNIMNELMGSNSPKVRLHENENRNITILSKFIENFDILEGKRTLESRSLIQSSENFAEFFVANALLGDYDIHAGNVGIKTDNNKHYIARIDNGRALSYYAHVGVIENRIYFNKIIQDANEFKQIMLDRQIYSEEMFQGIDFATNVNISLEKVDFDSINSIIEISILNLEDAYGSNFLDNLQISSQLKRRLGINKDQQLTDDLLKSSIIDNMRIMHDSLYDLAALEMSKFFPSHPEAALEKCSAMRFNNSAPIDYVQLLENLQNEIPNFDPRNENHFRTNNDPYLEDAKNEFILRKSTIRRENLSRLLPIHNEMNINIETSAINLSSKLPKRKLNSI